MSIDKFSSRIEFSAMTHFVRDLEDEGRSRCFAPWSRPPPTT